MGGKSSSHYSTIGGEDYVRCRVLGKGSFGKVYAMQHATSSSYRVVKEMHKGTILSKGNVLHLLLNERHLLSELKGCPFVVKCFASCQDDKYLYMLLEFCSGGELDFHFQASNKFNEETIRCYLAQMTLGLEWMHNKYHIIHRDLKPENVLLDENGFCAIIDFNMATKCDDNLNVPNPKHLVIGTLPYIAPELLSGKDHNDKVDWWSLGIMTYEFSHGRRPFSMNRAEGESDKKKMQNAVKAANIHDLLSSTCSEDLKDLICGLLEKDPEKRFGAEQIKKHRFFKDVDWDQVLKKDIKLPLIPDPNTVNFKPDANVEEVFGLSKPKESLNTPLTEEQQKSFQEWNWTAEDQELPPPDPVLLIKYQKKKKGSKTGKKLKNSNSTNALQTTGKLLPETPTKGKNQKGESEKEEGKRGTEDE